MAQIIEELQSNSQPLKLSPKAEDDSHLAAAFAHTLGILRETLPEANKKALQEKEKEIQKERLNQGKKYEINVLEKIYEYAIKQPMSDSWERVKKTYSFFGLLFLIPVLGNSLIKAALSGLQLIPRMLAAPFSWADYHLEKLGEKHGILASMGLGIVRYIFIVPFNLFFIRVGNVIGYLGNFLDGAIKFSLAIPKAILESLQAILPFFGAKLEFAEIWKGECGKDLKDGGLAVLKNGLRLLPEIAWTVLYVYGGPVTSALEVGFNIGAMSIPALVPSATTTLTVLGMSINIPAYIASPAILSSLLSPLSHFLTKNGTHAMNTFWEWRSEKQKPSKNKDQNNTVSSFDDNYLKEEKTKENKSVNENKSISENKANVVEYDDERAPLIIPPATSFFVPARDIEEKGNNIEQIESIRKKVPEISAALAMLLSEDDSRIVRYIQENKNNSYQLKVCSDLISRKTADIQSQIDCLNRLEEQRHAIFPDVDDLALGRLKHEAAIEIYAVESRIAEPAKRRIEKLNSLLRKVEKMREDLSNQEFIAENILSGQRDEHLPPEDFQRQGERDLSKLNKKDEKKGSPVQVSQASHMHSFTAKVGVLTAPASLPQTQSPSSATKGLKEKQRLESDGSANTQSSTNSR